MGGWELDNVLDPSTIGNVTWPMAADAVGHSFADEWREPMERLLFVMKLHAGAEAEYEKRHEAVWAPLLEDIWNAGLRNYSLFRRGPDVYAYAECHPDRATSLAMLAESKVNAEWGAWFEDVIAEISDAGGNLIQADEVWNLEAARAAAGL